MPSWGDRDEVAALGRMTIHELYSYLGQPSVVLRVYESPHPLWLPGLDRPAIISESPDPAVVAAMARCTWHRVRHGVEVGTDVHPSRCGWCDVPLRRPRNPAEAGDDGMFAALDYAIWKSRLIIEERFIWRKGDRGTPDWDITYTRVGRSNVYEHPDWALWAALPEAQRRFRTEQAITRSRQGLDA